MGLARLITGIAMVIIGGIINLVGLAFLPKSFVAFIYGIPIFILGLVILLNKNEDDIEKVRNK